MKENSFNEELTMTYNNILKKEIKTIAVEMQRIIDWCDGRDLNQYPILEFQLGCICAYIKYFKENAENV